MNAIMSDIHSTIFQSQNVDYFTVDRSSNPDLSPPQGYRHLFCTLDKGISWSGIQVSALGRELATDIQVFGLTGYGDNPLDAKWQAVAKPFAEKYISAAFSIYANHLVTPELRLATDFLQPRLRPIDDRIVFDRDGIHDLIVDGVLVDRKKRGVQDYMRETILARDLYAHHIQDHPEKRATYTIGHSIGAVAGVMKSVSLSEKSSATLAGCFTFGLVAGFAHIAEDPNDVSGFLGALLDNRTEQGKKNCALYEAGLPILALANPEMWFNHEFVTQYKKWNLLEYDPEKLRKIAPLLTVVTAQKDRMAQPTHVQRLYEEFREQGMILHYINEATHLFDHPYKGDKDGSVTRRLVEHMQEDFVNRRIKASRLAA